MRFCHILLVPFGRHISHELRLHNYLLQKDVGQMVGTDRIRGSESGWGGSRSGRRRLQASCTVSGQHPAAEIDTAVADCMQRTRLLLEVAGPDLRTGIGMVGGSACGQRHLNAGLGDICHLASLWHVEGMGRVLAPTLVLGCSRPWS